MNDDLFTPEELAAKLKLSVERTKSLARQHDWPCVKFSSKSVRYSPENVAAIIAQHAYTAEVPKRGGLPGQTALSRARST